MRLFKYTPIMLAVILAGCGRHEVADPALADTELRALAGGQTRVVWVQDTGNGSDTFAQGAQLRLMAFDTEDGRGERTLLPGAGNYAKPMIAPDGARVVFSDRPRNKVFVVNWDGTDLRELCGGFALAVRLATNAAPTGASGAAPAPCLVYAADHQILDDHG